METEHVHDVYKQIAPAFSATRHRKWHGVTDFLRQLPVHSLVADCGCGNFKYFKFREDIVLVGLDTCLPLLTIAKGIYPNADLCLVVGNGLRLPYRKNSFDAAISIAVIHHLHLTNSKMRQ